MLTQMISDELYLPLSYLEIKATYLANKAIHFHKNVNSYSHVTKSGFFACTGTVHVPITITR
jgi:hypothetical protein